MPDQFCLQQGARTWNSWVAEGLLLDEHSRGLSARMVTYNPDLRVWSDVEVLFEFQDSGSIDVSFTPVFCLSCAICQTITPAGIPAAIIKSHRPCIQTASWLAGVQ